MEILHQLGELFLQAVPTVIIVFLFYFFMRWAFFTPILKAMDERTARIEGAQAEAARAEAKRRRNSIRTTDAMRKARGAIYAEQEAARQVVLEERQRFLKAMRSRAQEDVTNGKKKIAAESDAARRNWNSLFPHIAGEIAHMILEKPAPLARRLATIMRLVRRISFLVVFLLLRQCLCWRRKAKIRPADTPTGWAFRWLNFAIVFGAIAYFAVKYWRPGVPRELPKRLRGRLKKARERAKRPRNRRRKWKPSLPTCRKRSKR